MSQRGPPARSEEPAFPSIPYGRHWIDEEDIEAVVHVLQSKWLTTGPKVREFEHALQETVGSAHVVALNNGTAALHAIMAALDVRPGDEVVVPAITFVATANAVVYQGGTPVFADVDPATLLVDPDDVERRITPRTKAVVAVDYAGQPCDYDRLREITHRHGLALASDACHALGARDRGRAVGSIADLTAFSFHPVKHITAGEGGAVATNNEHLAGSVRRFRNHGISTDHREREEAESWRYEMTELGYNYRITDFQCALGISQLRKLPHFIGRRREIAAAYDRAFAGSPLIQPLESRPETEHAYHLYVTRVKSDREAMFRALRRAGIGVNVHYAPVYLHPFYRKNFGTKEGLCPMAEAASREILSLPIYPAMKNEDVERVAEALTKA